MHVIFVEPAFPANQREFARGLHAAGVEVTGIGECPLESLDPEMRGWLDRYEQVSSVVDEAALEAAVRSIQARSWVDRLEATIEAHILPAAHVRERCAIPGTSARTAYLCRDKPAMKAALRKAGIPCAQSVGTSDPEEARGFARTVGFPLILKPRDGAGAAGTHKVTDGEELEAAIRATGLADHAPVAIEEFIEGHEGFYDSLTIDGRIIHDFVTHYYPGVLEAMRTRWISPVFVTSNRIESESYRELKQLGQRVIDALGIETSATHMEWFFGPKGLKFSEIGCRPPGVGGWDVYNIANEMDLYRDWASAIAYGRTEQSPSRRYAAAMLALRPDRDGTITGYDGVEETMREFGEFIIDSHFPAPGTPTGPVEAGYMANAWMRVRHPDYDELRKILTRIGERIQVRAKA